MIDSAQPAAGEFLLDVRRLSISAVTGGERRAITVGTDLRVAKGETVGIVGESGSGKSMTAKAIVRLLPANVSASGEVHFGGRDLLALTERELREIRGSRISLLFQDPFTMLNPLLKCGMHIEEVLPRTPVLRTGRQRMAEVQRRLAEVGITDADVAHRLPFQLSGGMGQRVALAAALARDPELLIADEPSTALDVTTQAEILKLLARVQGQRGMSMILITHDLRLAFSSCDRVYVLYAGSLLEVGGAGEIEREPFHPYTLGLLLSEPPAAKRVPRLVAIRGSVASADAVAGSCSFAPRCDWARESCRSARPPLAETEPGRFTACIRQGEIRAEMQAMRRRAFENGAAAAMVASADTAPLVRVTGVGKIFEGRRGRHVHALKEASIEIHPGESVGLVGESGSGKTTLGRCVVGLETPSAGAIEIGGITAADYAALSPAQRAQVRHTVQMVFQDPYSTLNPRHSVRRCLLEALRMAGGTAPTDEQVVALLREVGLPETYIGRRPAALSGGERQRVAIARALAVRPKILVCDEPVSSLDVSVQAQILNLFKRLQEQLGLSYLFITHDLAVVRQVAERVYVLYLGEIVEHGATEEVMTRPQHPYTRRLLESIPHSAAAGAP
jgi:peptide/nickel transport system ATP-binding protein